MAELLNNTTTIQDILESACERAAELYDDNEIEKIYLLKFQQSWKEKFLKIFDGISAEPFSVISHGDCWNNNMMFLDKKDSADKICLIDWQVSEIESPATDLSLYIMSSTTKELRDQYLDEFLKIYYSNLSEIVRLCGSDIDQIFKFSDLKNQLEQFGEYGVIFAPFMLPLMVSEPENIVQMDSFSENVHKSNDGDGGNDTKSMATFTEKSQKIYKQRLSDCIRDAIHYKWIE